MHGHRRLCDIGKADRSARFMRDGVPPIGRSQRLNTTVDHQVVECELGFVSHPKNSLSFASAGRQGSETFPKTATYCHLLPFCHRKTHTPVRTVSFVRCPLRGAGQPGPRAENRERGGEEPRCRAVTRASLSQPGRRRHGSPAEEVPHANWRTASTAVARCAAGRGSNLTISTQPE